MTRTDELRSLAGQAAQARADVEHLIERVRERARADEARVRRSAANEKERRLRRVRDEFRRDLASLRDDVHSRTRAAGPALAPWRDDVWKNLDPDGVSGDATEASAVRIGDLALFPSEDGEDLLYLPATLTLDEDDAVVFDFGDADPEVLRGALLGWCLRVVATLGRGRVSVVWFDADAGRSAVPVPSAWRPGPSGPVLDAYLAQLRQHVTYGGTLGRPDTGEPRLIVIVIGSSADRTPGVRKLADDIGAQDRPLGVHLLVASSSWSTRSGQGVLGLVALEGRSRFTVTADDLGKHELALQDAPPAALAEQLAAWTVPPHLGDDLAVVATEERGAGSSYEGESPLPAPAGTRADGPDDDAMPTAVPEGSTRALPNVAHLLGLLDAPPRTPASLTFGNLENGASVTATLERTVYVHGGSSRLAADRMAAFLVEAACQTSPDDVEFAVLDLSEDSSVAERFDRIVDLLPHLIDVADGVGVILALEEAVDRLGTANAARPARLLFAIAPDPLSDRVVSLIEQVAKEGPTSRVALCLWTPSKGVAPGLDASRDAVVMFDEDRATVQVGDGPELVARSAAPLSGTDLEQVGRAIRGARG